MYFVPININYSRTLEGESFPGELLGEEKLKESTGRLLKAFDVLKINFGQIYVTFQEPIDFKKYSDSIVPSIKGIQPY